MNHNPYIGVTGFMSRSEVLETLNQLPETDRAIMIGVLASQKTLEGQKPGQPKRYPKIEQIADIFVGDSKALNLVHYNTRDQSTICDQLIQLSDLSGKHCNGIQLNIAWPDPSQIRAFRTFHPNLTLVLQVGKQAFEMVENSTSDLAQKVLEYQGYIDRILIDFSGGQGKIVDTKMITQCLTAITALNLNIGLGIAGGLCSDALKRIEILTAFFPSLSIDAEGRLRTTNDNLDLKKVHRYLDQAAIIFDH